MRLSKFKQRMIALEEKHAARLREIEEAEAREIKKLTDPIVQKIGRVAEAEARRILEEDPELVDGFSFSKREAGRKLGAAIADMLRAGGASDSQPDEDASGDEDRRSESASWDPDGQSSGAPYAG